MTRDMWFSPNHMGFISPPRDDAGSPAFTSALVFTGNPPPRVVRGLLIELIRPIRPMARGGEPAARDAGGFRELAAKKISFAVRHEKRK